jgi:predicted GH43/DUF377 family glycosyl hydrolase
LRTASIAPTVKEHTITPPHDGRRAFNASIAEWDGRLWMAYRVSHLEQPDTLRIAELDPVTFAIRSDRPLLVPVPGDGWGSEDPRLFVHNDALHVAWTTADYTRRPWIARMFYGAIGHTIERHDNVIVAKAYQPRYGLNHCDQREKNWQFWSEGGCLFAQYGPCPQRVIQLDGEHVIGEWRADGFVWQHGHPSGGTPPILTDRGTLISFFHSFVPSPTHQRIYAFGAMEFERVAPFLIRSVSPKPILIAHDQWPMTTDHWSPLCVFPAGAIPHGDGYLVSAGINDSGIRLFDIGPDDMPMVAPEDLPAPETGYFRALTGFLFGGRVRTVGEVIEADLLTARRLLTRKWIQPYENQTA